MKRNHNRNAILRIAVVSKRSVGVLHTPTFGRMLRSNSDTKIQTYWKHKNKHKKYKPIENTGKEKHKAKCAAIEGDDHYAL